MHTPLGFADSFEISDILKIRCSTSINMNILSVVKYGIYYLEELLVSKLVIFCRGYI